MSYPKGAEFERKVKKYLEGLGWYVVRSAGSHSKIDLIALGEGRTLLIQCKTTGTISPADRQTLFRLSCLSDGHVAVIASKVPRNITPALERLSDPDTREPLGEEEL